MIPLLLGMQGRDAFRLSELLRSRVATGLIFTFQFSGSARINMTDEDLHGFMNRYCSPDQPGGSCTNFLPANRSVLYAVSTERNRHVNWRKHGTWERRA